jgi:hypothetical protein
MRRRRDGNKPVSLRVHDAFMDTINLQRGCFLRLQHGAGSTVVTHSGAVWITEQANQRDVVLEPGQSFTLSRPGLTLVEAFSDASISFDRHG